MNVAKQTRPFVIYSSPVIFTKESAHYKLSKFLLLLIIFSLVAFSFVHCRRLLLLALGYIGNDVTEGVLGIEDQTSGTVLQ